MADAVRNAPAIVPTPGLRLLAPAARFSLRGGAPIVAAAGAALGVQLPTVACRAAAAGEHAALWLGPDEWLLIAPAAETQALRARLAAALAALPHSLVDVSHRQVAFELAGARAAWLLNAGCPLDLDLSEFPAGMCTRTVFHKSEIVLWRTGAQAFRVEVWRSYAAYLSQFLVEAGRGII